MKTLFLIFMACSFLFSNLVSKETKVCKTDNIKNYDTKQCMDDWLNGNFGLKPYKPNYILPYGYRFGANKYTSYVPSDKYKNHEAELQVSLKLNVANNIFGLHESYNIAYSYKSFWQIYASSSPFRETNYNPEMFVTFPIDDDSVVKMTSLTLAIAHMSNGQGNIQDAKIPKQISSYSEFAPYLKNRSRSINYIYAKLGTQHDNLLVDFKVMVPYFGDDLSDNPDIMNYIGYTELQLKYFYGKSMSSLFIKGNYIVGKGALKATYSYPIYPTIFLYVKLFNGYGESLIDYNNNVTKLSIGFSFSR